MEDKTMREEVEMKGYGPTDDAFEEDAAGVQNDDEIFTDEYMLAFAEEADREIRLHMILDRIVTVVVILALMGCVAMVISIFI